MILIIVMFLTASCVSAADGNATDDLTEQNLNIESSPLDYEIGGNSNEGTFSDLNMLVESGKNGSEISLERDYVYSAQTDSEFISGIGIAKAMTIDGKGHAIDGKNSARIFSISSPGVTLKNIRFMNGHTADTGSAIETWDGLTVINSEFTDNVAEYGSAVTSRYGNITIINSNFTNNHAKDYFEDEMTCGGAVSNYDGNIIVLNSCFSSNRANYGGAIYTENGNISISDSLFKSNNGTIYGGAVYSFSNANITNCSFKNNYAQYYGGAIHTHGSKSGTLHITDSAFEDNFCQIWGGAIEGVNDIVILNSTFNRNVADEGGAICASYGNILISDCNFTSNNCPNYGTGVLGCYDVNVTILHSNFIKNNGTAGAIDAEGNITVTDCSFSKNTGDVSAIKARTGLNLINCDISGNKATNSAVQCYGTLNVINSTFKKNTAEYVGAIRCLGDVSVINSSITDNTGKNTVGGIYANNIELINTTLKNNRGYYDSSLLGNVKISNSKVIDSNADITCFYIKVQSNSKINANKKTFKTKSKVKKYSVTLKSGKNTIKNAKVSLVIKGKNYKRAVKAKTDSKGTATFKIKKLTKTGTCKATIKFKGNEKYKGVKKKLKISVDGKKCTFTPTGKDIILYNRFQILEGRYLNADDAYKALNSFRSQKKVWYWNEDDKTKTYFNTKESNTLKPLKRDPGLEEAAKIRAKELAYYFSHDRLDDTDWLSAYPDYGSGENIAYGLMNGADIVELWKEEYEMFDGQGHRRNMLDEKYDSIGIAGFEIYGMPFWVQCFGSHLEP